MRAEKKDNIFTRKPVSGALYLPWRGLSVSIVNTIRQLTIRELTRVGTKQGDKLHSE